MLKETFTALISNYTNDDRLKAQLWDEIESAYTDASRHYHSMAHLENLLHQLTAVKGNIHSWETILFTLYYHDIVYNVLASDNEVQSADLAVERMQQIEVPEQLIEDCKNQILATQKHLKSPDIDTNYFIDADLSVLGQHWEIYSAYAQNVRKEYAVYPDEIYNAGRKKVLEHFIGMEQIFKTDYFSNHFEQQAKQNLQRELELL